MRPGPSASSSIFSLPLHPPFSWDFKTVPRIDGKGPQGEYSETAVKRCNSHDLLPDSNSNMFAKQLLGPILKSQYYDSAKDLVKSVKIEKLNSETGA